MSRALWGDCWHRFRSLSLSGRGDPFSHCSRQQSCASETPQYTLYVGLSEVTGFQRWQALGTLYDSVHYKQWKPNPKWERERERDWPFIGSYIWKLRGQFQTTLGLDAWMDHRNPLDLFPPSTLSSALLYSVLSLFLVSLFSQVGRSASRPC